MSLTRFITLVSFVTGALSACASIETRKEWRSFTTGEQTAWITSVKVSHYHS